MSHTHTHTLSVKQSAVNFNIVDVMDGSYFLVCHMESACDIWRWNSISCTAQGSQQPQSPLMKKSPFLQSRGSNGQQCFFAFMVSWALLLQRELKQIFCLSCFTGLGEWQAATLAAEQDRRSLSQKNSPWKAGILCLHGVTHHSYSFKSFIIIITES